MAIGAPQTIMSSLIQRLSALTQSDAGEAVSPFVLQRLKADADKLMGVDPAAGSMAKSAIAGLEWDVEQVAYWIENMFLLRSDADDFYNAAISWQCLNRFDDALAVAERGRAKFPQNPRLVELLLGLYSFTGRYSKSQSYPNLRDVSSVSKEIFDGLVKSSSLLHEVGVDEIDEQEQLRIAFDIAFRNKVRIRRQDTISVSDDLGEMTVVSIIRVSCDLTTEMRLDDELAENLCSRPNWDPMTYRVEFFSGI